MWVGWAASDPLLPGKENSARAWEYVSEIVCKTGESRLGAPFKKAECAASRTKGLLCSSQKFSIQALTGQFVSS